MSARQVVYTYNNKQMTVAPGTVVPTGRTTIITIGSKYEANGDDDHPQTVILELHDLKKLIADLTDLLPQEKQGGLRG